MLSAEFMAALEPTAFQPTPGLLSTGQSNQHNRMAALMENVTGKGPGDQRELLGEKRVIAGGLGMCRAEPLWGMGITQEMGWGWK